MSVVLQVSDTHFGTERPEVVEALVLFARELRPDLVILSGDITQRARRRQFRAAERFCRSLRAPRLLAIPGNHDLPLFNPWARLFHPYQNYQHAFGSELEPEFSSPTLLALAVNTTRAHRHKNGEVSPAQVERVAERLAGASAAQLRIVVTHQPVLAITEQDQQNLLVGRELAIERWARAGADIVMGGHIHLPYVRRLPVSGVRHLWVVQAGTAVSRRVRGGISNSVNVIRHRDGAPSCRVERWDYETGSGFRLVHEPTLELDRAGTALPSPPP